MLSSKAYTIHATTVLLKFDCGIQSIAGAVLPEVQSSYTCFDILTAVIGITWSHKLHR